MLLTRNLQTSSCPACRRPEFSGPGSTMSGESEKIRHDHTTTSCTDSAMIDWMSDLNPCHWYESSSTIVPSPTCQSSTLFLIRPSCANSLLLLVSGYLDSNAAFVGLHFLSRRLILNGLQIRSGIKGLHSFTFPNLYTKRY